MKPVFRDLKIELRVDFGRDLDFLHSISYRGPNNHVSGGNLKHKTGFRCQIGC